MAFPFLKSLLKVLLLCYKASSSQVLTRPYYSKLLHLLAFPFLKSLLKVLLLCYKASSSQVLPNSKHQTLLLKTTSSPGISLSKVLTKNAASMLQS